MNMMFQVPPSTTFINHYHQILEDRLHRSRLEALSGQRTAGPGQASPHGWGRVAAERLALHLAPAITSAAQIDKMLNMPEEKWDKTLNVGSRPCRALPKSAVSGVFACV